MKHLHIDYEVRSAVSLDDVGHWAWATHPSTDVMCMAFATDDGPIGIIKRGEFGIKRPTFDLSAYRIEAHQAHFEYAMWNYLLTRKYGWPALLDPKHWDCTMGRAAMCNLPLGLDKLAIALDLPFKKDLEGRRIMLSCAKPMRERDALGDVQFDEDPAKYERIYSYCSLDVAVERAADKRLPELPPLERAIWELDLIINRRGLQVDLDLARAAVRLASFYTDRLNEPIKDLTNGFLDKASQVAAIAEWLKSKGVKVPMREKKDKDGRAVMKESLDKVSIAELLADKTLPPICRTVIEIRQQVGKSSTSKYKTLVEAVSPEDGRIRGTLQYHAAGTGRWAGRMFQPQNLPQGTEKDVETAVEIIRCNDVRRMDLFYDKPMETLSSCIRSTIIAGAGHKFLSGDYSAIEARKVFWLVGDKRALWQYHNNEDLYIDMGAHVYKCDPKTIDKKSPKRQLGKKIILGCGFGMGPIRFRNSCIEDQFNPFDPGEELAELSVQGYREKYPLVRSEWYAVEDAAVAAVLNPGKVYPCCDGKVHYGMSANREFLLCRLPSGRMLYYYHPDAKAEKNKFGKVKNTLHFWGEHPLSRKWMRLSTYGGALFENITQASARDVMANGMLECEKAGYSIVLTVHDELLSEVPDRPEYSLDNFLGLMCKLPEWAKGFPVAAEGWEGHRYRK